jgi:micrococcal nuclease
VRFLLGLMLFFALAISANAAPLTGVVIVVIDGDTVLFKPDHYRAASRSFLKVRLADIDAPESNQPHGEAATRALKALVLERRATLEIVATDTYGRKVGRLQVDALPINMELVRRGYAWTSTRYRRNAEIMDAQRDARRARLGLWQDDEPTPPWVWRRTHSLAY